MSRWSAAQQLSRIALEKPSELKEWSNDMHGQILPAQLKLHEAIVQRRITDIRGRLGPPGSKEQRLTDLFSDAESMGFTLLVTLYGTLTVHPPYKRHKFEEKHKIDLDDWWRGINFDQDESEQAFSASLAPCQRQPDRPHLRLVSGARSGETEAPAVRAEESMLTPSPAVEPEPTPPAEPPHGEPAVPLPEPASADVGDQTGAANPSQPPQAQRQPSPQAVTSKESPSPDKRLNDPAVGIQASARAQGTSEIQSETPAAAPHPGGRPFVVNWSMVDEEVFRLMNDNGEFSVDDPEWNAQARLENAIADFCETKFGIRPGETTIKDHIREPLRRWRQSRSET